jgi:hypothetical protein
MWRMRRLKAWEGPQLWHKEKRRENGKYVTSCGLNFGIAGSAYRAGTPAGACSRCLRHDQHGTNDNYDLSLYEQRTERHR